MRKAFYAFLFFLLLFSQAVFAQVDIGKIVTDFFGIIFVIAFIIILLAIGGVLHLPKVGVGHWGSIVILLILIFIVPYILVTFFSQYFPSYAQIPESFKFYKLEEPAPTLLGMLGLPSDWSYLPALIYLFILPFAGIYVIVWSFLTMLGIFPQKNVNRVLAFLITFLTIPVGVFVKMVWLLFSVMGAWSVAVFAIVFIAGIFLRGTQIVTKEYVAYKQLVDVRKARLKDAAKTIEALKEADLETITRTAPLITERFADVIPASVAALLSAAARATKVEDARAAINQALSEIKKAIG
jgi:hypothetical protein